MQSKNLIPHFISEKLEEETFQGNFTAITMFLDISGFTPLTERLMREGKEGAEIMASIINNIFGPVTDTIYSAGGFISKYAGDAFTAIFIGSDATEADIISCATVIRNIIKSISIQKTKFGNFELSVKIGISYGNIEWGIIGDEKHSTFYFRGEAIDGCALSEHKCRKMEIIIDDRVYGIAVKDHVTAEKTEEKYFRVLKCRKAYKKVNTRRQTIPEKIKLRFFPESIVNSKQPGEFREVIPLFISFNETVKGSDFNPMIKSILRQCDEFGGYFKEIDFGDKGGLIVIIFGAPVCYEDNNKRAMDFIHRISLEFKDSIKAGITQGIAFTGFIGAEQRCDYAALSDIVNQSARFMSRAKWGEIWISQELAKSIKKYYTTGYLGRMKFKGKSRLVPVYSLIGPNVTKDPEYFRGRMIGRKYELKMLEGHTKNIYQGKFGGAIIIYGEPGIGKSRLAFEFTKKQKNTLSLYLKTDNILRNAYNPFKYFLRDFFDQLNASDQEEKRKRFESSFGSLLRKISSADADDNKRLSIMKELKRTKSIIAAQIDIRYEDSLYEKLDARGIYENTLFAYKELFKGLSLLKPVIIRIEDIHWIDDASDHVFETLCRGVKDYPIIIIATSRINSDGSLPKLKIDIDVFQHEIVIDKLENEDVKAFIEINFFQNISPPLLELIIKRSENNPFYIEQLILYMKENKLLKEENGQICYKDRDIFIPQTISSVITARIDSLNASLKEIVRVSSVLGREGELRILKNIISMLETNRYSNDLESEFEMLENENIWIKVAEIRYIFKHALLHQTAYEMQLKSTLKSLHCLAGRTIEDIYKDTEDRFYEIASHYHRAEIKDKAIMYFEKASGFFSKTYQNKKVLECLDILLELTDDTGKKMRYLFDKCQIHELLGNIDLSIQIAQKSLKDAIKYKNHKHSVWFQNQLSVLNYLKNNIKKSLLFAERAIDLGRKIRDLNGLGYAYGNMGNIYAKTLDYKKAMHFYRLQERVCRKTGHKMFVGNAVGNMAIIHLRLGNYKKALDLLEKSRSLSEEINDRQGLSLNFGNIAVIYYNQGNYKKALQYLEKQKKINEEIGDKLGLAVSTGNLGSIYADQGNFTKAMQYFEIQRQIYEETDDRYGLSLLYSNYAKIYTDQGNFIKAQKYFDRSKVIMEAMHNLRNLGTLYTDMGYMYKIKGDYENAVYYFDKGSDIEEKLGHKYDLCHSIYHKADLLSKTGDCKNSEMLCQRAKKIAEELGMEDMVHKLTLLEYRLQSVRSPRTAVQALYRLIGENDQNEEKSANIHYEIWKINKSEESRQKALKIFTSLYSAVQKFTYKLIIEELSNS